MIIDGYLPRVMISMKATHCKLSLISSVQWFLKAVTKIEIAAKLRESKILSPL